MKPFPVRRASQAFTILELLVVLAILLITFLLLAPQVNRPREGRRVPCSSNLRQSAIGLLMWARDHNDRFPWGVSTNSGGTMERIDSDAAVVHVQKLPAGFLHTRNLVCPADVSRTPAVSLTTLTASNLSYFINVAVTGVLTNRTASEALLMGDRNLTEGGRLLQPGLAPLSTQSQFGWGRDLHGSGGNVLFQDGHVEFVKGKTLTEVISRQPLPGARIIVP